MTRKDERGENIYLSAMGRVATWWAIMLILPALAIAAEPSGLWRTIDDETG